MTAPTELTETSPELLDALRLELPSLADGIDAYHTGGGCMVAEIVLTAERRVWLTRDAETEWLVGFYDDGIEDGDEGICLNLRGYLRREANGEQTLNANDPKWVAENVAGVLRRVGVVA